MWDFIEHAREQGLRKALADRMAWSQMRMSPVDLADVTGYTYTYLLNGHSPVMNWTALYNPGETIRLRFINASTMSNFDVRIPGLDMEVVMADGKWVRPVRVHEFRMVVAETYDVLVRPRKEQAFTIFAESIDRSGFTRGTLTPHPDLQAAVPKLRPRPVRGMEDMGMDHGSHAMEQDQAGNSAQDAKANAAERGGGADGTASHAMDHTRSPKGAESQGSAHGEHTEEMDSHGSAHGGAHNAHPSESIGNPSNDKEPHDSGAMNNMHGTHSMTQDSASQDAGHANEHGGSAQRGVPRIPGNGPEPFTPPDRLQLEPWLAFIFPAEGPNANILHGFTTVAIALFLFFAGVDVNLSTVFGVWTQVRAAVAAGIAGMLVPFGLGFGLAWFFPQWSGHAQGQRDSINIDDVPVRIKFNRGE